MTSFHNKTFTLTFGDQAENHVGMQKIGNLSSQGFNRVDLIWSSAWFEKKGVQPTLYDLKLLLPKEVNLDGIEDAHLLVIPGGLNCIVSADDFFEEQDALPKDTRAYMYGRVVNKRARYNLCFNHQGQEPNYEEGKGRIVSFEDVPLLNQVRETFAEIIGEKGQGLVVEGNYYYDITQCGIGFHGDSERRRVIGVRVGESLPLQYQWFYQSKPVGGRGQLILNHGDIYIMSEKTTGNDWKRRSIFTLRHAAGAPKFLTIKSRKK